MKFNEYFRNPTRLNLQNALYHTIFINPSLVVCNKLPVTLRFICENSFFCKGIRLA